MQISTSSLRTLPPKLALALALVEKSKRAVNARERVRLTPHIEIDNTRGSLVLDPNHVASDLMKPSRYKVYYGGRGGVKSWAASEALLRRAMAKPIRVICAREVQNSIEDSVHHLLKRTIRRMGWDSWFNVTKSYIECTKTGSMFKFKGLRDAAAEDIKSFEDCDICWVEEAKNVSNQSWEFLEPTIRNEGSEIWATFNPEDPTDPVYDRFVAHPRPDSIIHKLNYDSNPYFPKVLEDLRQYHLRLITEASTDQERKQAQSNYDHIWLGEFKKINEALIFRDKCVVEDFPDDLSDKATGGRIFYGADFGFAQDPSTLIRAFEYERDLYISHEAYGIGVELDEMEEFYDSVPGSRQWPIKGDCSRPETISHLARRGFRIVGAAKWPGSVEDGIAHMRGFKRIVVHPRCKHTIDEMKKYSYKKDRITGEELPIIIDKLNHCADAIRYSLDGFIQRRGTLGVWEALAGNQPGR